MKHLVIACMTVVALAMVNSSASAGEMSDAGQVPEAQLAELGLGGMELLSDSEGEEVRGKFLFGPKITFLALRIAPFFGISQEHVLGQVLSVNDVLRAIFPGGLGIWPPGTFILP